MSLKDEAYRLHNAAEELWHKLPEHLWDDFGHTLKGIEELIADLESEDTNPDQTIVVAT